MTQRILGLYVFSLPFEFLWYRLFGIDTELKPYRILGLALLVAFALTPRRERRTLRFDGYDAVLLFFIIGGLGIAAMWHMFGRADVRLAVSDTVLGLYAMCTFWAIKHLEFGPRRAERLLQLYAYGVAASIALNVALGYPSFGVRFAAFSQSSTSLGLAITLSLHILLARILFGDRGTTRRNRQLLIVDAAIGVGLVVALLFTGSRGAMLAFAVSFPLHGVALLVRGRRTGRAPTARMVGLLLAVAVAAVAVGVTLDRYGSRASGMRRLEHGGLRATAGRYDIWRSAWTASIDYMFLGMGTAQYRSQHKDYISQLEEVFDKRMLRKNAATHSNYIEVLTAYGAIGLILFVVLLAVLFRLLARALERDPDEGWLLPALFAVLGLFVAVGMTHVFLRSPYFYFLLAIMLHSGSAALRRRRATRRSPYGHVPVATILDRVPHPAAPAVAERPA